jgi:hypothetical protein
MSPSDPYETWPEELKRRHRIWRAFYELTAKPNFHMSVDEGGQLLIGPAECLTQEAREHVKRYKDDIRIHAEWLGEIKHDATHQ